ncbi:MAG: 1-deoxy-D-xylulose-5-phosphate synthase [Clostridia bacterium]|nr:1-deoxy-D-xylulose-5-phosphate synthase [Clostridia bacterium]
MKSFQYLPNIHSPEDLRSLDREALSVLSGEIRAFLVEHVTKNGGHLASNLGVVELTLAIHRVFDSPRDHIIFDVGHQSYVHKIVTGRADRFDTLRQNGGLSGFTKRSESPHDPFGAGHASTSLSAALGMADAEAARGSDAYTVCVVGDGAFTGGMIHEALNNVNCDRHLVIILNENEMSISPNRGHFADHLAILRATESYHGLKNNTRALLGRIPVVGDALVDTAKNVKQSIKDLLYQSNYFENLGLYYLGPADGNDLETVETLLRIAKDSGQSVILHLKTKKGKGYPPAEAAPDIYHAVPKNRYYHVKHPKKDDSLTYSDVFGHTLLRYMRERDDLRVITAAMTDGTGLRCVADAKPEYLIDVGIAEEHAITYAAGLSAGGLYPVAAIYSSFLQRSYDNIIHDAALQRLPMTLCIDRAGFNEGDGATHHGIFDVAMLSQMPQIRIFTPMSYASLRRALAESFDAGCITAIRYPKGAPDDALYARFTAHTEETIPTKTDFSPLTEPKEVLIVTYGRIAAEAVRAEETLSVLGIPTGVVLLEQLTPYERRTEELTLYAAAPTRLIVYLEEGICNGGAGMILRDGMEEHCRENGIRQIILAVRDPFAASQPGRTMAETAGIDAGSIVAAVCDVLPEHPAAESPS